MPLEGAAKAKYMKERAERIKRDQAEMDVVAAADGTGLRFKSEVLSYRQLCNRFYGLEDVPAVEDDEKKKAKKPKKSIVRPKGSLILGQERSFGEWLDLRDKARKDLFWLGRDILKRDLLPHVHQKVCDQFVQKNFDGAFPEGYTLKDVHDAINRQERYDERGEATKEMMLLDPRGFYKSTIDGIDCVQWLINCPDVRILILTGEYKLALSFMKEIKDYFFLAEGAEPTDFHLIFPEYILRGVDGTSKEPIEIPARRIPQRFPSLWVNSIDANLSGWHCDVRKTDDVVTDTNCNNEKTRLELKEKVDGTDNLLDEWGFSDYIGTRYWVDDYYGTRLKPDEETGEVAAIKYMCRQCWTIKPEYSETPLKKLTKEMVMLAFPEKATFASLRKKLLKNERSFRNQQLNEPSEPGEDSAFRVTFDEDVLRAHMISITTAPREGDVFITWDWAPSSNKYSDMSVGCAARIYKKYAVGRDEGVTADVWAIAVLEVVFDRWKPSELARSIVNFDKKWMPKQTLIEKSNSAELLQLEIQRLAMREGVKMNVYWRPLDMRPDAKRNRVKNIETLLTADRFYICAGPWIDETFRQFLNYTGERKNRGRKDDICDAISFQCYFLPATEFSEDRQAIEKIQIEAFRRQATYDRIFGGQGGLTPPEEVSPAEQNDQKSSYRTQQERRFSSRQNPQPVFIPEREPDPRNRYFGGNGLHV